MQAAKSPKFLGSNVLWTLVLIVALSFCFLVTMFSIQDQARESCYDAIEATADQAVYALNSGLQGKISHLQIIADILASEASPTSEDVQIQMDYLCNAHEVDALYLRTADGTVCSSGSQLPDFSALPPLEQNLVSSPYVSDIFPSAAEDKQDYLYCAVPMVRDQQTVGILYGFLSLNRLSDFFDLTVQHNDYQIYLLDASTGDFLLDASHNSFHNLYDGSLDTREVKSGYSVQTMLDDIRAGRSGYIVFRAHTTGGYYYTRYQPAGINNWYLQLALDEESAFAGTAKTNKAILSLAVIVVMLTACYLLGFVLQQKRNELMNKQQLLRSHYMYDVQQILFDSYKDPGRIPEALERVCKTLDAGAAVLLTVEGTHIHQTHIWEAIPTTLLDLIRGSNLETDFPSIFQHITQEKSLLLYEEDFSGKLSQREQQIMVAADVHSIMLIPVIDTEGILRGTLFAVDMGRRFPDCTLLECVAHEFMMALRSVNSYQLVRDMGLIDHLTGLKSRNSYESALASYSATVCQNMYCIFIDANGLHEINNHFGHSAGDIMLRSIADEIIKLFGRDHTYRIGGDEFVVFVINAEESSLVCRMKLLQDNLQLSDYFISIGWAWQSGQQLNLERLISQAEAHMYQDKRNFYEKIGKDRGISLRLKNSSLEQQLQDRQDNEALLSLMHTCFRGIYAVNLNTDAARILGPYDQFSQVLEGTNYRFFKACQQYIPQILTPEQTERFFDFCNYSTITDALKHGQTPVHHFQKTSGEVQMLRIYPAPSYSPQDPDTYWMFEKISDD